MDNSVIVQSQYIIIYEIEVRLCRINYPKGVYKVHRKMNILLQKPHAESRTRTTDPVWHSGQSLGLLIGKVSGSGSALGMLFPGGSVCLYVDFIILHHNTKTSYHND